MSTPAAKALEGTAGTAANSAGGNAGAQGSGAGAAGAGAAGASNAPHFWDGWSAPEQKETRDWVANKAYADPFVLAKTAQGLEREAATLRSGKGYPVDAVDPKTGQPKRDDNAWKAWNTLTGVPESADKYEWPQQANDPYPQFRPLIASEFQKAGVPAAMAPQLAAGFERAVGELLKGLDAKENETSAAALKQLESSWGADYAERMQMASRGKAWLAQEAGGLNDVQMRTLEAVLGTDKFLTAMWKIGAGNGEARFAGGDHPGSFTGTASEAQAELDRITAARNAGSISDMEWREHVKPGGKFEQLRDQIVRGMAPNA